MSESTARDDDSKIPQRVRSAQVVSLGSYASSAKPPVAEARKSDRVQIRRHTSNMSHNVGTISIGAMNRIRESGAGATEPVAPIVSSFVDKWTCNFNCTVLLVNRKIIFTMVNSC